MVKPLFTDFNMLTLIHVLSIKRPSNQITNKLTNVEQSFTLVVGVQKEEARVY